jgi:ABC-type Fe3+/spermidine/putrescine transport system ATPase subunit
MNGGNIEQIGTPQEVYERPATRFVAEFIGKANMIELAQEVEHSRDGAIINLRTFGDPVRIVIPAAGLRFEDAYRQPPTAPKWLFIRPEKIAVLRDGADGQGGHVIPGRVKECAYAGDHQEYLIEVNHRATLRVLAAENSCNIGADVRLRIAPEDLVLYG